jgi:hypothetical protein
VWAGYSIGKGFLPFTVVMSDCQAMTMTARPALLDVFITVRRQGGAEWQFLAHRRPGLRHAITGLHDLIA